MIASQVVAAIDIGGTKLAGGLVETSSGKVFETQVVPTAAYKGGQSVLSNSIEMARNLCDRASRLDLKIQALGVSICELVDLEGNLASSHTIDWSSLSPGSAFAQLVPTFFESDVRAQALAEAKWGAGRGVKSFLFVNVGTGIGSSFVLEGEPWQGAHGNAVVLATSPPAEPCPTCGYLSSLEEFASGRGIVARYNRQSNTHLRNAYEVVAMAEEGDSHATAVLESAGRALGARLALIADFLDPEALVVGGGLGSIDGIYWKSMVETCRRRIYARTSQDIAVVHAQLGPDAALAGAGLAAARRVSEGIAATTPHQAMHWKDSRSVATGRNI